MESIEGEPAMSSRRLFLAPVLMGLLLVTASCTNPFAPSTTETQEQTVAPEVKTAVEQYVGKINARDAAGAGEFYADDQGFHWADNGRIAFENRAAAIAGLSSYLAGFPESRFDAYDIRVAMLNEEAAVATFKFTQTVSANGQASLKLEGMMSLSMAKRDGIWKIVSGHKSSDGALH
jgi:hypothetical protein